MQNAFYRFSALKKCLPFEKKAFLSMSIYEQEKIVQLIIADSWPKKPSNAFLWKRVAQYMIIYHADLVRHFIAKATAAVQGSPYFNFTPTKRGSSPYPIDSQRAHLAYVPRPLYSPPLSAEDAYRVVSRSAHRSA